MASVRVGVPKVHPTTMQKAASLNPAAYNPRRITVAKLNALKQSIRLEGFVHPLVVQKSGTKLIGGHQRLRAMKELCAEAGVDVPDLPCILLDVNDRRAKILNFALNNDTGENDEVLVGRVLASIVEEEPLKPDEMLATGFSQREVSDLLEAANVKLPEEDDEDGKAFASSVSLSLTFDSVSARDATKGLLAELAKNSGKKSGELVRTMLEKKINRGGKRGKRPQTVDRAPS